MKAKARAITPAKLRLILAIGLFLILALNAGVFYLAYRQLGSMAGDVAQNVADANDSRDTIQELQKIKQDLEANQDVINKTARIAADGQDYQYQDQLVSDLTTYANRSGMTISNITFTTGTAGATAAPAAPAATPTPATQAPAGLKKTTVSVTLKNPADYKSLLNFLHYVEQNLTRLKIANVTLTKGEGDTVNTDVLSLEVYLR
jgi:hypothetical protein